MTNNLAILGPILWRYFQRKTTLCTFLAFWLVGQKFQPIRVQIGAQILYMGSAVPGHTEIGHREMSFIRPSTVFLTESDKFSFRLLSGPRFICEKTGSKKCRQQKKRRASTDKQTSICFYDFGNWSRYLVVDDDDDESWLTNCAWQLTRKAFLISFYNRPYVRPASYIFVLFYL